MDNSLKVGNKVTILDCTLRDGGYCNNWQFNKKIAHALVSSLNASGVDIIEIGYKSPRTHRDKNFEGLFRFCTESQLQFLKKNDRVQYAFMIDAKEFLDRDHVDADLVKETIPLCSDSLFDWVRVATYAQNFSGCNELISDFKEMGYKVSLNLMGISLLNNEQLKNAIRQFSSAKMDVLYFSDSFGDLTHDDVLECITLIKDHFPGKIGIHTHDNNGLAFANTLCAIDAGIDFIDCTVMGMGRGAGNLRTEQILLHLYFKKGYTYLNPSELLDVINTYFTPLKEEYKWGWDYTYMLSALQNIHPTYCMNLRSTNQYSIEQVSAILNGIAIDKRKKYDEHALLEAIDIVVNEPRMDEKASFALPLYEPEPFDSVLVLATGPSVEQYNEEIIEFIRQHQPLVIECNPKNELFESVSEKYLIAILNWVRLKKWLDMSPTSKTRIVTGLPALSEKYAGNSHISTLPCHIGINEVVIERTRCTLPAYVVGMFSVILAQLSAPKIIYLSGFDGYQDNANPRQIEMNVFWNNLQKKAKILSITPTTYELEMEPIYKFIR